MINDTRTIPLDAVRINGGTQSRVALNEATIAEYAETIRGGVDLPPVITFFDGVNYWLADGFHRYFAHKAAGAMEIMAEVREGTCREAVLYSVGANASHGLRRSNEDKRRAVMTLLNDPEWSLWSARNVAGACNVSSTFVDGIKSSLQTFAVTAPPEVSYTSKHGTKAVMNTANIGKVKSGNEMSVQDAPATVAGTVTPDAKQDIDHPAPVGEVEALRDQLAEVSHSLKSTLADNEMMGRAFDADDRIKASMEEAKRQKAIADSAETQYNGQQGKLVALAKQVTHWMNRALKAEKSLAKLEASK